MTHLEQADLQRIESSLRTQLHNLEERIETVTSGQADETATFHASYPHDPGEESGEEQFMETGQALLEHLRAEATDIERALTRIAEKTYGDCTRCGEAIPAPRLQAIPTANHCIQCESEQ